MNYVWEEIGECCKRLAVPGGWLILSRDTNFMTGTKIFFLEDSEHYWKKKNWENQYQKIG